MFNKKPLFYFLLPGVISLFAAVLYSSPSHAAFNPGYIIDDPTFTNYNSMNAAQIQQFLNQNNSVCLKDFRSQSLVDDNGDGVVQDSTTETYGRHGTMSAAELIAAAARIYRINPQVLLVTLQKEQGLITRSDCPQWRYNTALGYGCPDSAPCDNSAFGFTRQIDYGAYHFRGYFDDSLSYVPFGVGNYNIGYNPNPACGSSNVFIQNRATAALYSYTPYQPNAGALAAGYGEAPCGAYGNRNFYLYFSNWFGLGTESPPNYIWNFETLDGSSQSISTVNAQVGNYPTSVNLDGSLHTFYYDIQNGDLKHSWIASGVWNFETLDGAGGGNGRINADVGSFTKALIFDGKIYLFYKDFQNGDLRMAIFDNTLGWNFETLDGAGGGNGRINADVGWDIDATSDANSLHIFYSNATGGNLQHAWKTTSNNWSFETLDGDISSVTRRDGNIGQGVKSQFIGNSIHLFYYSGTSTNLIHGWIDPARGWQFEDLDGASQAVSGFNANIGWSPSFVYTNNSFHVYYHDIDRGALRHAWFDPARGWQFEHLDGIPGAISRYSAHVGLRSSIVMEGPVMNIFYYNGTDRAIRHAWFDSSGWHFLNLDGGSPSIAYSNNNVGENVSAVLWGGNVQVFYFDAVNQTLRHAWGAPR